MQTVNNLILDTTNAANGDWRNVSNFVALSIQIINLEGTVWIEASNDPDVVTNGKVGVNISGNLAAVSFTSPPTPTLINAASFAEIQVIADNGNGNQVMFNVSCLLWQYLRVRKSSTAQTKETKAWLVGQNG